METEININKKKFFNNIDLILPAYNEQESIKKCIEDFESLNIFSSIIVVDNNSTDSTKKEINKTKAKYFFEKEQGYGSALLKGFKESTARYIITCEPDLTFSHKDVYKFLLYLDEFDCVFGTRTSKSMIGVGAKMNPYLRYGNILVAKLLEYLFRGPSLTDVGCSFKAFDSVGLKKIINMLKVRGSHFQPELMIRLIESNLKIIEIPVFYLRRTGYSKITYSFYSSLSVAINMLKVIIGIFIKKIIK